ncbi:MAG: cytochrome b/b6 domain-containing protein [Proteobacteria bacterium]|nr:cytochrome b/b6 domain-containing protein [Pseudomonadota bacterium]
MHDRPHDQIATALAEGGVASSLVAARQPRRARVWDSIVRSFHWSLVAAIALAAATGYLAGASWIDIHVWAGAAAATLIVGRVVWGFFGTTHARFSDFIVSPKTTLAHARALIAGRSERHRGHNPLGAMMIVALLLVTAALAVTGVLAFGGVLKAGPLAFVMTFAAGWTARQIHEALALMLLGLIGLHIAGAIFESWRTRENLVRAMVDGRKEVRPGDHVSPQRQAQPLLAASVVAVLFAATAVIAWTLSLLPGHGVPVAKVDPVYAKECGACHTAYHPSLLPRASWRALLAGLDNHFGEDASLDPATATRLADYLAANAAETADTLPANRLRLVDAARPFTITATPFWTRRHAGIPDAVFASKAVRGRGNCVACHADAGSGRFYPGNIDVPDEATP